MSNQRKNMQQSRGGRGRRNKERNALWIDIHNFGFVSSIFPCSSFQILLEPIQIAFRHNPPPIKTKQITHRFPFWARLRAPWAGLSVFSCRRFLRGEYWSPADQLTVDTAQGRELAVTSKCTRFPRQGQGLPGGRTFCFFASCEGRIFGRAGVWWWYRLGPGIATWMLRFNGVFQVSLGWWWCERKVGFIGCGYGGANKRVKPKTSLRLGTSNLLIFLRPKVIFLPARQNIACHVGIIMKTNVLFFVTSFVKYGSR